MPKKEKTEREFVWIDGTIPMLAANLKTITGQDVDDKTVGKTHRFKTAFGDIVLTPKPPLRDNEWKISFEFSDDFLNTVELSGYSLAMKSGLNPVERSQVMAKKAAVKKLRAANLK